MRRAGRSTTEPELTPASGKHRSADYVRSVPAMEVARRLGHSVAMLLKRYANCIDGQQDAANERIARALGDGQV